MSATTNERVAIIGNAGGGKSTLARRIASVRGLPLTEVDTCAGSQVGRSHPRTSTDVLHEPLIAGASWIIEGLGHLHSVRPRLLRATWIIFIDMPLWMHFWLAAERQIQQEVGALQHPVAGRHERISTRAMFETLWETEHDWMPTIRAAVAEAETAGVAVTHLTSVEAIDVFAADLESR